MRSRGPMFVLALLLLTPFLLTTSSLAIPAFSRQYGTSCTTCHVDFPKLNDFGKAFKDAGFKFPKDDESFLKVPDGQHASGSFQVNAAATAPTISSITPNPLTTTAATWMTVNGTGFQSAFTATVSGYSIASVGLQFR